MKAVTVHIILILGVILSSCKEDEPYIYKCENGDVKFELFNDELNPGVRLIAPGNTKIGVQVIQSEHELYSKLDKPYIKKKIDFKTRSLIVVNMETNTLSYVVSQQITADCVNKKLIINANMKYGSNQIGGISYLYAIVPKIPEETSITFIHEYTK